MRHRLLAVGAAVRCAKDCLITGRAAAGKDDAAIWTDLRPRQQLHLTFRTHKDEFQFTRGAALGAFIGRRAAERAEEVTAGSTDGVAEVDARAAFRAHVIVCCTLDTTQVLVRYAVRLPKGVLREGVLREGVLRGFVPRPAVKDKAAMGAKIYSGFDRAITTGTIRHTRLLGILYKKSSAEREPGLEQWSRLFCSVLS
jgi:hypothetical protein